MDGQTFIKVILPLKLSWEPYYLTSEPDVRPGMRARVAFAGKEYIAVISEVSVTPELSTDRVKEITRLERHLPIIDGKEISLWRFISEYYLCTIGEVYRTAYPSMKSSAEQVSARYAERQLLLRAKSLELYHKKVIKLEDRLKKKEEAISGKHSEKVLEKLKKDRDKIKAELDKAVEFIVDLESCTEIRNAAVSANDRPVFPEEISGTAEAVLDAFRKGRKVLLEGGAGRMEAIIETAADTIRKGRGVLMLVPEIAIGKHLQNKLASVFGDALMVFHSEENASRKRDIASALRNDERPLFILGTRSALFLPFKNLGLVIINEEHDIAYKQDCTPRYSGRDMAVVLGDIHGADVLLSSHTPSLESLLNCLSGRYDHVRTKKDSGAMEIIDTAVEKKKGGMVGNLSRSLIKYLSENSAECRPAMIIRPWGPMDDLAEEIDAVFPDAMSRKRIILKTLREARVSDISGFGLIAILGMDLLLDKQDFRADERAFQTLSQFRSNFPGRMIVQTGQSGHPVFSDETLYPEKLLAERKAFRYPPYTRMIEIKFSDNNGSRQKAMIKTLKASLEEFNVCCGDNCIRVILAKDRDLSGNKKKIAGIVSDFEKVRRYSGHIVIDVDPV